METRERASAAFPAGQGDMSLITVDNVIFHVHRAVLRHSSPVFETVLEQGRDGKGGSSPLKLKFEAEKTTLDHLLMFAYPNKISPSIQDISVLAALFRAAKRYEMDGVLHQLRLCLTELTIVDEAIQPPLYIRAPLAVLAISYAFDCTLEARLALRECVKGNLEEHIAGAAGFDVPAELFCEIVRLRRLRMDWFTSTVNEIPWNTSCSHCIQKQGEWRVQLIRELHTCMQFETLKKSFDTAISGKCNYGHQVPNFTQADLERWKANTTRIEETLPPLPHISR